MALQNEWDQDLPHKLELSPRADRKKLESPIEEWFIQTLEKHLSHETNLSAQSEVVTPNGIFRLDFLLTRNNRKVGLECDGKEFHDDWQDEWRDGLILGSGCIDAIYRFRGKDICSHIEDCIFIFYICENTYFNDRYPLQYRRLISEEALTWLSKYPIDLSDNTIDIPYHIKNAMGLWEKVRVTRRDRNIRDHWNTLFKFSQDKVGLKLEELMDLYRNTVLKGTRDN